MKESLNSDSQQFHQYQQNELHPSRQLIEYKASTTDDVENLDPGVGQVQTYGEINPVNGILSS